MTVAHLPHRLDESTIPEVMAAIGLPMPPSAIQLRAEGKPLAQCGYRRTIQQVDEALAKTALSMVDRLTVKIALSHNGLIGA